LVKDEEMLEELKKIRALLEPKPAPPPPTGLWAEFKSFIENYKVFDNFHHRCLRDLHHSESDEEVGHKIAG